MNSGKASKLVQDLSNVPSIVGALGLSVAEAQKAFNVDYLENVERLLGLIKSLLGNDVDLAEHGEFVKHMLANLAPSRYQFTETTLAVRLDLAQTMDLGAQVGFSAGTAAVAVNAALTVGYGYDYRAAAEVRAVLHAIPADAAVFNSLLGRAKEVGDKALDLPPGASVDAEVVKSAVALVEKLTNKEVPQESQPQIPAEGQGGEA